MDTADVLGIIIEVVLWACAIVLSGFFVYWWAKFLNTVPEYLKRIAVALEKIANKK